MSRVREHIVPIIIGLILGCILAAPVIAALRASNGVKVANHATQVVIDEATKQHDIDLARITALEGQVRELERDNDDLQRRLAEAAERDRAERVRASRSRRATPARQPVRAASSGASAWAHGSFAIQVSNCESADLMHWPHSDGSRYIGNAHLRDPNGHYGKWQFDLPTWRSVGGSGNPADASEAEQDARAYALFQSRGWQPWACARILRR